MDSLGQNDYKDRTMLTPINMSFDCSTYDYTNQMNRSPIEQLVKQVEEVKEEDFKQKNRIVQLDQELKKYFDKEQDYQKELKKLKDKEQDYQKEVKKLKDKDNENAREISNLTICKNQLKIENLRIKSEFNEIKSEKDSILQDCENWKNKEDKYLKEIDTLKKKNRDLDKQLNECVKTNTNLSNNNRQLNEELKKKLKELNRFEDEFNKLEISKRETDAKYKDDYDRLTAQLVEKNNEVDDLNLSLNELRNRTKNLELDKSRLKRNKDELEEKLKESNKYIKELNELNDKLKELNFENKKLSEDNDQIKKMKNDADTKIENLELQLDQIKEYHKNKETKLEKNLKYFKAKFEESSSNNEELKESLASLNDLINQVNADCDGHKTQLNELEKKNYLLKKELNEKNENLNELKDEIESQKADLAKLNEEKLSLTNKLEDTNNLVIKYNELFKEHFNLNPNECQNWCLESTFTSADVFTAEFIDSKLNELNNDCQKKIQIKENKLKELTEKYEDKLLEKENLIKKLNENQVNLAAEKDLLERDLSKSEQKYDRLLDENCALMKEADERNKKIVFLNSTINKLNEDKRKIDEKLIKLNSIQQATELDSRSKLDKENKARTIGLRSIDKSKNVKLSLDHNSNYYLNSKEDKLNSLDENLHKNSTILNQTKYSSNLTNYSNSLGLEHKKFKDAQQRAEDLLKEQGYYNSKKSKANDKPEVCFNLKGTEDDSSLENVSNKVKNNLEKYSSFREHLNFADLERKKSSTDKQSTIKESDEDLTSNELLTSKIMNKPKSSIDYLKRPTNKFILNKPEVQFTSTPLNKNTKIKKLNYEYK